jgi:hypothetical protein
MEGRLTIDTNIATTVRLNPSGSSDDSVFYNIFNIWSRPPLLQN